MAISDAATLGSAISKHEGNLEAALQEYQKERVPQTAKEVCLSLTYQKTKIFDLHCLNPLHWLVLLFGQNDDCI